MREITIKSRKTDNQRFRQKHINLDKKVKSASICVGILQNERYIENIDATDAKREKWKKEMREIAIKSRKTDNQRFRQKHINLDKKVKSASICVGILQNERYIENIDATDAK